MAVSIRLKSWRQLAVNVGKSAEMSLNLAVAAGEESIENKSSVFCG